MKLTGGQIVCESLIREGVDTIFGLPGGAILPLYQTLSHFPQLKHILVRHEQGAAHAADGYARVTGKPGVAWATSGPGATNLITGMMSAYMDSIPMVLITGQVGRAAIGSDAFQECDIQGISLPVTKHNYLVMEVDEIAETINEAFHIANTGRPGPVHIDIPKDIFTEITEFEYPEIPDLPGYRPNINPHPKQIKRAVQLIEHAQKPVILAGHGVLISKAQNELLELAEKAQIPVINTLMGVSNFPSNHILYGGWPGMHGMAYASLALEEADLIIGLGTRFDDRITGNTSMFARNSKKIHVDIDPSEIGKIINVDVPIVGDLKTVISAIRNDVSKKTHGPWLERIDTLKREHPLSDPQKPKSLQMKFVIDEISKATNGDAIIVTGVGQHQMWAAQYYPFKKPNSFISSSGSGAMGYEVPAAMGAQVGSPDRTVWSICGDGGFQMTMYELATIVENNIPVKFAIMNNNSLGMVRQWQELFYDQNYFSTIYSQNPDFVKLAEAFGMPSWRVSKKSDVNTTIAKALAHSGPTLIDFVVEQEDNVNPMIPAGMSINELIEEPVNKETL